MLPELKMVALVSIGQHIKSGRFQRADQDARAVELGLKLRGEDLTVLHAGSADEPVLRRYLGAGLKAITVLEQPAEADIVGPMCEYLNEQGAQIILTGTKAECGEASGMIPYLVGERLGWPVVSRVADILSVANGEAEILQALPRGQRRLLKVRLPFVASVDNAADAPRQSAFGPGQRGHIHRVQAAVVADELSASWTQVPAKKRPKRLAVVKAKSAADRFKAATAKSQGAGGVVLQAEAPREQAQAIVNLLLEEGLIQ